MCFVRMFLCKNVVIVYMSVNVVLGLWGVLGVVLKIFSI